MAWLQELERQWEAQSSSFAHFWLKKRAFWQWHSGFSTALAASQDQLAAAAEMAFANAARSAFGRWQRFVELQREGRERLHAAFLHVAAGDAAASKQLCLGAWKQFVQLRRRLTKRSNVAVRHAELRLLQSVVGTWAAFTSAMRAEVNPSSPFLSPRSAKVRVQMCVTALSTSHNVGVCSCLHCPC